MSFPPYRLGPVLALVPARGGSRRLPGKNLRPLRGRSLLARAIDGARACSYVDRVVVTTDDPDLADEASRAGAEVPFLRPPELATDAATTGDVIQHALRWLSQNGGYDPGVLLLLQPTSPLRTTEHITRALEQLAAQPVPASVLSVTPARPASWLYVAGANGQLSKLFNGIDPPALADGARLMLPNGAIYAAVMPFFHMHGFLGPGTEPFVMPATESVDVDTADDWALAEALLDARMTDHDIDEQLAG